MKVLFALAAICVVSWSVLMAEATVVKKCEGNARKLDTTEVSISNCTKGRCRFRKRSNVTIKMNVTPDHDVQDLRTTVNAIVLSLPLPFIGVDGLSARPNMFDEDGQTKAKFPLKAGQKYVYKNSFKVLPAYPVITALDVHWALTETNNRDLVCFEVPARITSN